MYNTAFIHGIPTVATPTSMKLIPTWPGIQGYVILKPHLKRDSSHTFLAETGEISTRMKLSIRNKIEGLRNPVLSSCHRPSQY